MKQLHVKTTRSIERALQVLNCFSLEEPELSISDLVKKTELSRATLYRIIKTMQDMDYVRYDKHLDKYRLSIKLYELGQIAASEVAIQKEVAEHLDRLFEKTGHTILLATLKDQKLIYLDKRESDEGLKISSKIGKIREPDYGILGRTLIASLPHEEQETILKELRNNRTDEKMADLEKKIAFVKENGYLFMMNETLNGVAGISVPVDTKFTLSIGVLFPSFQIDESKKQQLIQDTMQIAKEISTSLS